MLIEFKGKSINLDRCGVFEKQGDIFINFYINNIQHYFTFKSKFSRDYNYKHMLDMYRIVNVLILEDVDEDEQIIEDFK